MDLSKIKDKFPALYGAAHPLHTLWRTFCQMVVWIFYRRYEYGGLENLPRKGAVLLCANHPCSLVDAVIIQAICPRIIHPLARSGLFKNPIIRPILTLIQAIPVYRRQDNEQGAGKGDDTSKRNTDTFDTCYQKLKAGRAILIFPEGVTHSDPKMRKFKTGAARMTLGAMEQNGVAPVLLPIGLNYSDAGRFRSSVFVKIGTPIPINKDTGK